MQFLDDSRLYTDTQYCLSQFKQLRAAIEKDDREIFHMFWIGPITGKVMFSIKSFLSTQNRRRSSLWLWLDKENGFEVNASNELLRPVLPFVQLKLFDATVEARLTPLASATEIYDQSSNVAKSNFVRCVVLHNYGGTYVDADTMFLRDFFDLYDNLTDSNQYCYRWSSHMPYANSAVLRLKSNSSCARALLEKCSAVRNCGPRSVLRFEHDCYPDFSVLPCALFDPLWPHNDKQEKLEHAPFNRFADFFKPFGVFFRRQKDIESISQFFPGAFAYHWHNQWQAPEVQNSYFGLFNDQFDQILASLPSDAFRCGGA